MNTNKKPYIIFTDLDGTLLDHHTYSFQPVSKLLKDLESLSIPVIFNTSKTRAEILSLREKINNNHPFIVENGSGIFIPTHYFSTENNNSSSGFESICLGEYREVLIHWLDNNAKEFAHAYTAFNKMSIDEIISLTGLSKQSAELAATREFSEPLHWTGTQEELNQFSSLAREQNFEILIGGRFVHLLGKTNKGIATHYLTQKFIESALLKKQGYVNYTTIACGDGKNDIAMLEEADIAVIVKSPTNSPPKVDNNNCYFTKNYGPDGWAEAIKKILKLD